MTSVRFNIPGKINKPQAEPLNMTGVQQNKNFDEKDWIKKAQSLKVGGYIIKGLKNKDLSTSQRFDLLTLLITKVNNPSIGGWDSLDPVVDKVVGGDTLENSLSNNFKHRASLLESKEQMLDSYFKNQPEDMSSEQIQKNKELQISQAKFHGVGSQLIKKIETGNLDAETEKYYYNQLTDKLQNKGVKVPGIIFSEEELAASGEIKKDIEGEDIFKTDKFREDYDAWLAENPDVPDNVKFTTFKAQYALQEAATEKEREEYKDQLFSNEQDDVMIATYDDAFYSELAALSPKMVAGMINDGSIPAEDVEAFGLMNKIGGTMENGVATTELGGTYEYEAEPILAGQEADLVSRGMEFSSTGMDQYSKTDASLRGQLAGEVERLGTERIAGIESSDQAREQMARSGYLLTEGIEQGDIEAGLSAASREKDYYQNIRKATTARSLQDQMLKQGMAQSEYQQKLSQWGAAYGAGSKIYANS